MVWHETIGRCAEFAFLQEIIEKFLKREDVKYYNNIGDCSTI